MTALFDPDIKYYVFRVGSVLRVWWDPGDNCQEVRRFEVVTEFTDRYSLRREDTQPWIIGLLLRGLVRPHRPSKVPRGQHLYNFAD